MTGMSSSRGGRRVLAGLIGSGIQQSLTPALHMREGAEQGIDYRYELMDLDRIEGGAKALDGLIESARARSFAGLNITHPCKQSVIPLLESLSPDAQALGAVNTVVFGKSGTIGHNTDWWGFAESFRRGLAGASLERVVLLGAGGAGSAVAYAILKLGARHLEILDLDGGRTNALVSKLSPLFPGSVVRPVADLRVSMCAADGLLQATTTGMLKNPGMPLPANFLERRHWIVEIVYFPLETQLLRHARQIGCRALDGGGMAVFQAVEAMRLFTGIQPDAERMTRHFDSLARPGITVDASA